MGPDKDASHPDVKVLEPKELLERMQEAFIHIYTTLIAIVQGLTLTYLVIYIDGHFDQLTLSEWSFLGISAAIIIETWIEYAINTMAFVWVPTILDALIPLLLGIAEIFAVHSVMSAYLWFMANGIIAAIVSLAYINLFTQTFRSRGNHEALLLKLRPYRVLAVILSLAGIVLGLVAGAILYATQHQQMTILSLSYQMFRVIFSAILGLFILVYYARGFLSWSAIIKFASADTIPRRRYGENRFPHREK